MRGPGVRAIIAALEEMEDDMVTIGFNVSIAYPLRPFATLSGEPEVEVEIRFVVPARVAERHGMAERKGLPQ